MSGDGSTWLAVDFSRQLIGLAFGGSAATLALWVTASIPEIWAVLIFGSFVASGLCGCAYIMTAIASLRRGETDPFEMGARFFAVLQVTLFFAVAIGALVAVHEIIVWENK